MKGYVYKYTNKINGNWYIGSHNGKKKNYSGSGTTWNYAKNKYGLSSFEKTILYEGPNYREEEERILIELDAIHDPKSYNGTNKACGCSLPGKLNPMYGTKMTPEQKYKCGNGFRGKKRPDHSEKMKGEKNPMYGKNYQSYGLLERAKENKGKTYDEIYGKEKSKQLKERLSQSQKGKKHMLKEVVCPHCGKIGKGPNMTRYHFENCKTKV